MGLGSLLELLKLYTANNIVLQIPEQQSGKIPYITCTTLIEQPRDECKN